MDVLEFRKIVIDDIYDSLYDGRGVWSRGYEYPLVISRINQHYTEHNSTIHNTSWGFEGVHVLFKDELDRIFPGTVHSDIKGSSYPNTFIYDITQPPLDDKQYDFVVNVSTLEEVSGSHISIFNNLFSMVKPGGIFIATFDLPGLQLSEFESLFNMPLKTDGIPISGDVTRFKDLSSSHLTCGIMVLRK
jgi:hypothetical protein